MRLLLDTQIFIWASIDDAALPGYARAAIADSTTELFVSVASAWEIAIKTALGKLRFPISRMAAILDEAHCQALPITLAHAIQAAALPHHHGDPFDRMLIAQAQHERLTIVTTDTMIQRYAVTVLSDTAQPGQRS